MQPFVYSMWWNGRWLEPGGCGLAGGGALHFGRAYVLDFAAAGNRGVERGGGIAENVAGS